MANPILIANAYSSHEDAEGDYILCVVNQSLIDLIKSFHKHTLPLPQDDISGVQFYSGCCFSLIKSWCDETIQEIIDRAFSQHEKEWVLVQDPNPYVEQYIAEFDNVLRIDLQYIGFLPGKAFPNDFRFECHLKHTSIEYTSPMIPISAIEEAVKTQTPIAA